MVAKINKQLPKPVDWDELYEGRFLKAGHLNGQMVTFTIADVIVDELLGDKGEQKKGIIRFREDERELALNKTNGKYLLAMFGRRVAEWKGKRVTLKPDKTKFGPEVVDCIRIFGSPDISAPVKVTIKQPKRKPVEVVLQPTKELPAAPKAQAPTVADYEACQDQEALDILEARRGDHWKYLPGPEKKSLKEASDACKQRLAQSQHPSAETEVDESAEPEPFNAGTALQELTAPADADALQDTWAAVCDHFDAINQEVPRELEAAYILSKETFAQ